MFSVPVPYEKVPHEYTRNGVERKYPYCDYEYRCAGEWSFAYSGEELAAEERSTAEIPFSSETPPLVLKTKVTPIDWGLEDGFETVCAAYPLSTAPAGAEREIELWPYGCAKLRMTQLLRI